MEARLRETRDTTAQRRENARALNRSSLQSFWNLGLRQLLRDHVFQKVEKMWLFHSPSPTMSVVRWEHGSSTECV
jgi:hypothetical protein